jgi:hypothetical protein
MKGFTFYKKYKFTKALQRIGKLNNIVSKNVLYYNILFELLFYTQSKYGFISKVDKHGLPEFVAFTDFTLNYSAHHHGQIKKISINDLNEKRSNVEKTRTERTSKCLRSDKIDNTTYINNAENKFKSISFLNRYSLIENKEIIVNDIERDVERPLILPSEHPNIETFISIPICNDKGFAIGSIALANTLLSQYTQEHLDIMKVTDREMKKLKL